MSDIALKTLRCMEKKLILLNIDIRKRHIKKVSDGRKMDPKSVRIYKEAWDRGRIYGEKVWRAKLSARLKEIQYGKNAQENQQIG